MMEAQSKRRYTVLGVLLPVLVLLGLQFALGFARGGFANPRWPLLQAPGALLGWGGVVLLAVPVAWLIAGWVGKDLFGLQGAWGLAVRLLGCVALGVACGALLALAVGPEGGEGAGGSVGAGIARTLASSPLGTFGSLLVLVLMLGTSAMLTIAPFFRSEAPAARAGPDAVVDLRPPPGLYEGTASSATSSYPERRYDEDGNEIPMEFDARDVGSIRYVDAPDDEAEAEDAAAGAAPAAGSAAAPLEVEEETLPEGVRFADEAEEPVDETVELVEVDDRTVPLPPGVRFADEPVEEPPAAHEPAEEPEEEVQEEPEEELEAEGEEDLPEEEEEDEDEGEEDVEPETEEEAEREPVARQPLLTDDDAVTGAFGALSDEETGRHYRAKLDASGIFDEPPPRVAAKPEAPAEPATPRKKATPKKKTTTKKSTAKKSTAKKKAAPKKKTTARKKATPQKKATAKKKASATKKAPARKTKAAPQTKPPKGAASPEAPAEAAPPRKGSGGRPVAPELYARAVEVALERGAASSVLLSRRLGIGYSQARGLIETLVADEILGEMTPSGSRPLRITAEEWEKLKPR